MGVISGEVPGVGREGNDSRHSEQGAPDLMIEEKGRWCELISSMGSNIMTEEVVMRGGAVHGIREASSGNQGDRRWKATGRSRIHDDGHCRRGGVKGLNFDSAG